VRQAGFHIIKAVTGRYVIKSGLDNAAIRLIDKASNRLGIGGITLYATKPGES
jgi:hypothetical protein